MTMMNTKTMPISMIKPYWRNPRRNEDAFEAVKQSIQDYGYNQPIVVDTKNVIVVGHTRYKALLELGYKEAIVVVVDLPADKVKQYRIADNKTAEMASWDMNALIAELREISDATVMQIYFHDYDVDSLLQQTATVQHATQEEIMQTADDMNNRFQANNQSTMYNFVNVSCPHCHEEFYLDRAEINRMPGESLPEE